MRQLTVIGKDIVVMGSSELAQSLMDEDLVDEDRLLIPYKRDR
jgi:dihydrofolate reductase